MILWLFGHHCFWCIWTLFILLFCVGTACKASVSLLTWCEISSQQDYHMLSLVLFVPGECNILFSNVLYKHLKCINNGFFLSICKLQMEFYSELGLLYAKSNFSTIVPRCAIYGSTKMHLYPSFLYVVILFI